MNVDIIKLFGVTMLTCMLLLTGITSISANTGDIDETDPDKVFPVEQVEEQIEKAKSLEVVADKNAPSIRTSLGSYPTRKGVILVTDDSYKGLNIGHAAIIYNASTVIEANEPGVEIGKNNWNTSKKQAYGVSVASTTVAQDSAATDWCINQVGKPYNWEFYRMDYRHKFYCSHLVRAAFLDKFGIDLNTGDFDALGAKAIHPMELVNGPETYLIYRNK